MIMIMIVFFLNTVYIFFSHCFKGINKCSTLAFFFRHILVLYELTHPDWISETSFSEQHSELLLNLFLRHIRVLRLRMFNTTKRSILSFSTFMTSFWGFQCIIFRFWILILFWSKWTFLLRDLWFWSAYEGWVGHERWIRIMFLIIWFCKLNR